MPSLPRAHPGLHQLRFVLESSALVFRFILDLTSQDIAWIWDEIADRRPESETPPKHESSLYIAQCLVSIH